MAWSPSCIQALGNSMPSRQHMFLYIVVGTLLATVAVLSRPVAAFQFSGSDFQCHSSSKKLILQWVHSVEKEQWQEVYEISGRQLLLTTTQLKTFGAGTTSTQDIIPSDDGWLHFRVNRRLPRIHWVVSHDVQSTVVSTNGTWPLYQDLENYAEVQVRITQAPRWRYVTKESCDDNFHQA